MRCCYHSAVQAAFIDAISTLDFVDVLKDVSEYRKTLDLDFSFYGIGFHTDISKLDTSWNKLYTEIKTKIEPKNKKHSHLG